MAMDQQGLQQVMKDAPSFLTQPIFPKDQPYLTMTTSGEVMSEERCLCHPRILIVEFTLEGQGSSCVQDNLRLKCRELFPSQEPMFPREIIQDYPRVKNGSCCACLSFPSHPSSACQSWLPFSPE
jgi:hypothetical protein